MSLIKLEDAIQKLSEIQELLWKNLSWSQWRNHCEIYWLNIEWIASLQKHNPEQILRDMIEEFKFDSSRVFILNEALERLTK